MSETSKANDPIDPLVQARTRFQQEAERDSAVLEYETRRQRVLDAWKPVTDFRWPHPMEADYPGDAAAADEACNEWAALIIQLGKVLKENEFADRLEAIPQDGSPRHYAVTILQAAVAGEDVTVERLLRECCPTYCPAPEDVRFAGRAEVSEWLRQKLIPILCPSSVEDPHEAELEPEDPAGVAPRRIGTPKSEESGLDDPESRTFLSKDLREMTGFTQGTVHKYLKLAGVATPGRGGRNRRFTVGEVKRFLEAIISSSSTECDINRAKDRLAELTKAETKNKSQEQN